MQTIQHDDDCARYFYDTEFNEDGFSVDLISIGIVADDGREYYAVSSEALLHRANLFVRQHVLPQLPRYGDRAWKDRAVIADEVRSFLRPRVPGGRVELWAYYAAYDHLALCQLYGTMLKFPAHLPKYTSDLKQYSRMLGNPEHPAQGKGEHDALADARWNKQLYAFLRAQIPGGGPRP